MTDAPQSLDQRQQLAGTQLARLQQLLDLLIEEQQALQDSDAAQLVHLGDAKANLIDQLTRLDRQQRELSREQSSPPFASEQSAQLARCLDQVSQLSQRCMQQNQLNGRIIRSATSAVQQALDLVRGNPAARLYSQRGVCENDQAQKSLGSA